MEKSFWEQRWEEGKTGWDLGDVSPPLKAYIDQIEDKTLHILIPGCGNAYEAQYLFEKGFKNVFIAEIAQQAIDSFLHRFPHFPKQNVLHTDFFEVDQKFDLVFEQTFFCALHPTMRDNYVQKMHEILNENGLIVGLLFNFPLETGPPFGGSKDEYESRFQKHFDIELMETSYNSVKPRQDRELFIRLRKK